MTLQQLHYVITIAESGSLNKAAEILYIAQPSLSSSIQELERGAWDHHLQPEQARCHADSQRRGIFAARKTAIQSV